MKRYFIIIFLALQFQVAFAITTSELRANYITAVSDKKICQSMIKQLFNNTSSALQIAYLGAFQTIWANHVQSPIEKLHTFTLGKNNIEKAIRADANDIEIRFLRYSVQKNCPKFLGYNQHLQQDKKILLAHIEDTKSDELKKMIEQIIKK